MQNEKPTPVATLIWSDWDAENFGIMCEPGVGIDIADDLNGLSNDSRWLSWDQAVALHAWLGKKIEETTNAAT